MVDNSILAAVSKATYEMSETLFMPATVIILVSEFPYFLAGKTGGEFFGAYIAYVFCAVVLSLIVVMIIGWFDTEKSYLSYFFTGVAVLPLGIFSVVPEATTGIQSPIQEVTGYCLIVWGLYLMYLFNSKPKTNA
jgi:hypothetical protein